MERPIDSHTFFHKSRQTPDIFAETYYIYFVVENHPLGGWSEFNGSAG